MRWAWIIPICLAGCGLVPERWSARPAEPVGEVRAGVTTDITVRPQARPGAPVAAVPAAVPAGGGLGRTVATLGNAGEPGLWLKTPLVRTQTAGRVEDPATGTQVNVTLIPIEGPVTAGSRLSLQAMQALGVALTDLVEVNVIAGG